MAPELGAAAAATEEETLPKEMSFADLLASMKRGVSRRKEKPVSVSDADKLKVTHSCIPARVKNAYDFQAVA